MQDEEKQVFTTYGINDIARVMTNNCEGCHACCQGMGTSVRLDPLDIFLLTKHLQCTFEQLLEYQIELQMADGLILPNLKMNGEDENCTFLNEEGRCSIHSFRPGLCRTFPLGRQYEGGRLRYFLLQDACAKKSRSKMKISKWLDTPQLERNQRYLEDWHDIRKQAEYKIHTAGDANQVKQLNMLLLQLFFVQPYQVEGDFYEQFYERKKMAEGFMG